MIANNFERNVMEKLNTQELQELYTSLDTPRRVARLAFLVDTAKHFSLNNRGVDETGRCRYGEGCAIGRHLSPALANAADRGGHDLLSVLVEGPEWMKRLGLHFLSSVQNHHDHEGNWTDYGISKEGTQSLVAIKELYCHEQ